MSLLLLLAVIAAPSDSPIKVGVTDFPPMIVVEENRRQPVNGSDYEMFEALVNDPDIGWKSGEDYDYVVVNSFESLIQKVKSGEIDLALAGISITHDRLHNMDFSQPYKNSGLGIMVPVREDKTTFWSYASQFFQIEILYTFLVFIAILFIFGALLRLVEVVFAPKGTSNVQTLEQGVLAMFDISTTIGFGRYFPVTRLGQCVACIGFFCGTIVVAMVVSTLTSANIVQHLEGEIDGPEDLRGKVVSIVDGTTSGEVLKEYSPEKIVRCGDFYKAAVQLGLGEVDAVVADDPVVLNYLKENPTHGSLAGAKFHPEDYGIAFAPDTEEELIKKFSIAIARLRESGKLSAIESQWFGE